MTTSDTIGRVPRPRGVLSGQTRRELDDLKNEMERAIRLYRRAVVDTLAAGCSFNEVSKATGLSKDTLQRWKREAGK